MEDTKEIPLHVAMVPSPGIGHIIPITELAKRLVHHHNLAITFFIANDGSPMTTQRKILQSLPETISTVFLPPVNFDDLLKDAEIELRIALSITRSIPALRDSFKVLTESTRVAAMVVDMFGTDAFDVAKEFGVKPYIFCTSPALALSLIFHLPEMDRTVVGEFRDLTGPFKFPGCIPVKGIDLPGSIQDRKNLTYQAILSICKRHHLATGIMVNSFMEIESGALNALMDPGSGFPPVYPVGPLTQTKSLEGEGPNNSNCLDWLDRQPKCSVLYVCFGSGGTLSQEQLNELAMGLEMSGQRFIWAVKSPNEKAANASYFGMESIKGPFSFLPGGFLERTKEVGLAVPSWAPQVQILSHESIGGFLTHCGWNSTLESVVHGVPLIAWPLYAEQKMNATLLAEDLKVAFRVEVQENGIVGREDIAKYVKRMIEGEEGKLLRSRMDKLKNAAYTALSEDGSSTKSLAEVVEIWKNHQ